jgi:hypothetical protein
VRGVPESEGAVNLKGVAHCKGKQSGVDVCVKVDFSEMVKVVRLDMWVFSKTPDVALAAALSEAEAKRLIVDLAKAILGMKRWHRKRARSSRRWIDDRLEATKPRPA